MKNNSDVQKDEVAYDDNLGYRQFIFTYFSHVSISIDVSTQFLINRFKALQRRLQQRHNEVMQSSKAMRQKQTIKRTKDRQQARRKKKIYNKTLKQRGKRCRSNDN